MRDWHGMEKRTKMTFFYTIKKPKKEDSFCRVVTLGKTHLKVHGYMHSCIVNQLIELEIVPSLGSFAFEQSRSKQKWKSIIKQGKWEQPKLKAIVDGSEGSGKVLPCIGIFHNKSIVATTSTKTPSMGQQPPSSFFQVVKFIFQQLGTKMVYFHFS
jgi:hypothetical protein